jgi:hypothetical protein
MLKGISKNLERSTTQKRFGVLDIQPVPKSIAKNY